MHNVYSVLQNSTETNSVGGVSPPQVAYLKLTFRLLLLSIRMNLSEIGFRPNEVLSQFPLVFR